MFRPVSLQYYIYTVTQKEEFNKLFSILHEIQCPLQALILKNTSLLILRQDSILVPTARVHVEVISCRVNYLIIGSDERTNKPGS